MSIIHIPSEEVSQNYYSLLQSVGKGKTGLWQAFTFESLESISWIWQQEKALPVLKFYNFIFSL